LDSLRTEYFKQIIGAVTPENIQPLSLEQSGDLIGSVQSITINISLPHEQPSLTTLELEFNQYFSLPNETGCPIGNDLITDSSVCTKNNNVVTITNLKAITELKT